jgi:hypothetical protein
VSTGRSTGSRRAFLGARLGAKAVELHRDDRLTAGSLLGSVDWVGGGAQLLGTWLGVNLVTSLVKPMLINTVRIGPVALLPLLGGLAGATMLGQLVRIVRREEPRLALGPERPQTPRVRIPATSTDPAGSHLDEDLIRTPGPESGAP